VPTPTPIFAELAARYGDVDPQDIEAVQRWFAEDLPKLGLEQIERIIEELLTADGAVVDRKIDPVYPDWAPLPSLRSSPRVETPLFADPPPLWLRRLAAKLRRSRGR
jgi:hypothetical protein